MAEVPIAGADGIEGVPEEDLSEDELKRVAAHWKSMKTFLAGDSDGKDIADFEGEVIRDVELVTDLDRIEELGAEGQLSTEEWYEQRSR